MTAGQTPFDLGASYAAFRPAERRWAAAPAEGWSSVLLLAFMAALVGWAIDDAHWVLGDQALTDFLPWAGILGVLAGTAGALLGRGRLVAHGLGAVFATIFLTWAVAGAVAPGEDAGAMFRVVGERTWGAWSDLVIEGRATTSEVAHFLLVLGILVWGTGQFAAYAALAHRRALAAVVIPGTILFVNVAITARDQFALLVLYTLAALLLLVRAHVADEERTWARHRIADVGNAVSLSLRAGLTFISLALVASLGLTVVASSAPLAGAWQGLDQRIVDVARRARPALPGRRADALRRRHVRLDHQHLGPVDLRQHARPVDHHRPPRAAPQVASRRLRPARREPLEPERQRGSSRRRGRPAARRHERRAHRRRRDRGARVHRSRHRRVAGPARRAGPSARPPTGTPG